MNTLLDKKIYLLSLGCAKNLVDGEFMSSKLREHGFTITSNPEEAQIAIVNTCGFIDAAKEESIQSLLEMADLKEKAMLELLIASGCMSERYADEMQVSLPEVDAILGVRNYKDIVRAIEDYYLQDDSENTDTEEKLYLSKIYRSSNREDVLSHFQTLHEPSTKYFAYLKIAEGCSNHCAFCAIPKIRGPFQSRAMEDILEEANYLVSKGFDELIVIAQDSGFYGLDLYKERKLAKLLQELDAIDGLKWIKVLYLYAEGISDELLDVFEKSTKLVPYFDIPIQHASDKLLKAMNRKEDSATLRRRILNLRERFKDAVIRTTVMVGFPGETAEDVEELLNFMKEIRFDRLGCFMYSAEEGTKAYEMTETVPQDIMQERFERVMQLQAKISDEILKTKVGQKIEVKIEALSDDGIYYTGRSTYEVPEVDPLILVLNQSDDEIELGKYYTVEIIEADTYELTGVIR